MGHIVPIFICILPSYAKLKINKKNEAIIFFDLSVLINPSSLPIIDTNPSVINATIAIGMMKLRNVSIWSLNSISISSALSINFNSNATIFISFYPDKLLLDHTKDSDEFTAFSIPGWDFAICYNSFSRYNFCAFDSSHNALYVNSKIKTNYKTNITVVLDRDEKIIKVYQDGIFIGETQIFKKLFFYKKEPFFYLGVGNPNREKTENYFRGTIDKFAYFDDMLEPDEVFDISTNENENLTKNFKRYKSSLDLKTYYDANFIENYQLVDLSGNGNNGIIKKCEITDSNYDEFTEVKIPFRRPSLFKSLPHEQNGFLGTKWKDQATRWNQLRFFNEVCKDNNLLKHDGLSTLEFAEHGKIQISENITHVNVGI